MRLLLLTLVLVPALCQDPRTTTAIAAPAETTTTTPEAAVSPTTASSTEASSEDTTSSTIATSELAMSLTEASSEATTSSTPVSSEATTPSTPVSSEATQSSTEVSSEATTSSTATTSEVATSSTEASSQAATTSSEAPKAALSTPDLIRSMEALVRSSQPGPELLAFPGDNLLDPQAAASFTAPESAVAPPSLEEDPEVAAANAAFLVAFEAALNRAPVSDSPVVARAKALHLEALARAQAQDAASQDAVLPSPAPSAAFSFFSGFPQSRAGLAYTAFNKAPSPSNSGFYYSTVSHHPFAGSPFPSFFSNPYVYTHPARTFPFY